MHTLWHSTHNLNLLKLLCFWTRDLWQVTSFFFLLWHNTLQYYVLTWKREATSGMTVTTKAPPPPTTAPASRARLRVRTESLIRMMADALVRWQTYKMVVAVWCLSHPFSSSSEWKRRQEGSIQMISNWKKKCTTMLRYKMFKYEIKDYLFQTCSASPSIFLKVNGAPCITILQCIHIKLGKAFPLCFI